MWSYWPLSGFKYKVVSNNMQVCTANLFSRWSPKILNQQKAFLPISLESHILEFEKRLKQVSQFSEITYVKG